MDKLTRTINSAHNLASAYQIENTGHVNQIVGLMARKLADGYPDRDIYAAGRSLANQLAQKEHAAGALDQLIEQVRQTGNPLTAAQALSSC